MVHLEAGTVQLIDTLKRPSGETTSSIAGAAPFVECRTLFYGPDDRTGNWPGVEELIVPRGADRPVPSTRKRILVELEFDAKFAALAGTGVVVSGMRYLDERQGGHDNGSAASVAIGEMTSKRRRPGNARSFGLDARTVAATVGGNNIAESSEAAGMVEVRFTDGSTKVLLAGGIEAVFGLVDHKTNQEGPLVLNAASDPLSHSFVEVSLRRKTGTRAVSTRREFTENGELVFSEITEGDF